MSRKADLRAGISGLLGVLLLGTVSCSYNPNDYSCFTAIDPAEGWAYDDGLVYLPEIADSAAAGALALMVRHTNDYPYSNLWVEVRSQQTLTDGHLAQRCDTFQIPLADIYGNWRGSGRGDSYVVLDTIYPDFTLISQSPLRLRHVMRPERVGGLEQVGFIFSSNQTPSE